MSRADEFYQFRELNLVLDYFQRKARGDFSIPVPSLLVFENVAGSELASLTLATFTERELRAIYFDLGQPVSQAQAARFMECWHHGEARSNTLEIAELEDEIEAAERELESLRDELHEARRTMDRAGAKRPGTYVPEELQSVIEALQREGA